MPGPATASAGEVAPLAFVGRPGARLFGEPSAELTTGVTGYPLFDGATLALAAAAMTDGTGATHPTDVAPDERVATDWTAYGTEDNPMLVAAVGWLSRQPACARDTPSVPEKP